MALGKVGGNQLETTLNIDSGTLYVDGANNRVGIGTQNPGSTLEVSGAIQATGNAITVSDDGFNSRINLFNTGSGGSNFSLYSTMSSFGQGANTFMLYSPSATNGIIKADSSGRVTMPYALAVSSYLNSSHSHTGTSNNKVNNWAAGFGTGHLFPSTRAHSSFDYTNSRFTAPVAGLYLMSYKPDYGTAVTTSHYVSFGINGAARNFDIIEDIPINVNGGANYTAYLYLNQNDYVEMYTHGGATYSLNSGGNQWNTWWFILQLS